MLSLLSQDPSTFSLLSRQGNFGSFPTPITPLNITGEDTHIQHHHGRLSRFLLTSDFYSCRPFAPMAVGFAPRLLQAGLAAAMAEPVQHACRLRPRDKLDTGG